MMLLAFFPIRFEPHVGCHPSVGGCGGWERVFFLFRPLLNYKGTRRHNPKSRYSKSFHSCFLFLVFVICWSGALTGLLFFVITKTIGVRVSPADEDRGMDVHHTSHGFAYDYLEKQAPTGSPECGDPPAQPPVELPVQPHQPNVEMSAFPGATNQ